MIHSIKPGDFFTLIGESEVYMRVTFVEFGQKSVNAVHIRTGELLCSAGDTLVHVYDAEINLKER